MTFRTDVFDDFHLHGASAPEWNQRYLQVSPGSMRSRLVETAGPGVHIYRKWLSERVVQQGALPLGKLCFALLLHPGEGLPSAQGRPLPPGSLLQLRPGEEFTLQRPKGMELLAITVEREALLRFLDDARLAAPRPSMHRSVLQIPRDQAQFLREQALGAVANPQGNEVSSALVLRALTDALLGAEDANWPVGLATATHVVHEVHRMVVSSLSATLSVQDVCTRLRISRRTLQNSFRQVAGTTPLDYMRTVRLNAVRASLLGSDARELDIAQAAIDGGFDHLSHFASRYKALFGELPSRTPRGVTHCVVR